MISVYEEQSLSAPSQGYGVGLLLGGNGRLTCGQPCQPALFASDQVASNRATVRKGRMTLADNLSNLSGGGVQRLDDFQSSLCHDVSS